MNAHTTMGLPYQAENLPDEVEIQLPQIVEDSIQSAFKTIADNLEALGYPVSGDFAPDEVVKIEAIFESFVRSMALNNTAISTLNSSVICPDCKVNGLTVVIHPAPEGFWCADHGEVTNGLPYEEMI